MVIQREVIAASARTSKWFRYLTKSLSVSAMAVVHQSSRASAAIEQTGGAVLLTAHVSSHGSWRDRPVAARSGRPPGSFQTAQGKAWIPQAWILRAWIRSRAEPASGRRSSTMRAQERRCCPEHDL